MTLKIWLGRGGKQPLRPKDDGMGLMVSAMKGRELGFGYKLTAEELAKVNEFRTNERTTYMDQDAAKKVHGTATVKPDLNTARR